jgi:hypothetical protein
MRRGIPRHAGKVTRARAFGANVSENTASWSPRRVESMPTGSGSGSHVGHVAGTRSLEVEDQRHTAMELCLRVRQRINQRVHFRLPSRVRSACCHGSSEALEVVHL